MVSFASPSQKTLKQDCMRMQTLSLSQLLFPMSKVEISYRPASVLIAALIQIKTLVGSPSSRLLYVAMVT